jgi:hypothetical protein
MEDMATGDDLEHTLNPFHIADKELFMRAQDPTVSFTELLLGDARSGFSLEHQALSESLSLVQQRIECVVALGSWSLISAHLQRF